jgi:hypothetical protein
MTTRPEGDPLSMVAYGLAILPLIRYLQDEVPDVSQPWYADDARAFQKYPCRARAQLRESLKRVPRLRLSNCHRYEIPGQLHRRSRRSEYLGQGEDQGLG